ncbi:MAG TPA: Ig-like domain repeat protein [Verrucomicrobiae bacterium]|nr:Ig-like domain repeat protein [Verrucomicrobiae bacterium]
MRRPSRGMRESNLHMTDDDGRFFRRSFSGLLLGLLLLAGPAWASDNQLIFTEYTNVLWGTRTYNNGWQDYGGVPFYVTNNPVHSGTNALCLAPNGTSQKLHFVHGAFDTSIYTNLTFWINGGASGGQALSVGATLSGTEQATQSVGPAPTNSWKQVTVSLASLGVANKTNFDGLYFHVSFGTVQPPVYLDDISLVAAAPPATVHLSVNAAQTVRTVDAKVFGLNQVAWDGNVDSAESIALMNELGGPCLRWPGGSWGDGYHWTNENVMSGSTYRGWGSFSANFIRLATNTHAQAFIICNYGSSDGDEAAYGVRMFNITNHCGFKYWEIGNEVGGSWEMDWNTNAPWVAHDPWTYAMRFTNYYAKMKAADPTIKIGAVIDITEDGTVNNHNHPVVNPRTGVTHYGWTPVMLTYMRSNNCLPDFVIDHKYPPVDGDTGNLLFYNTWKNEIAGVRQMLNDYLGSAATNITIENTESGTGGDKQCVSLVGGLQYADDVGQILQTEANSRVWWDTRNGQGSVTNCDNALYGWRTDNYGYYYDDGGIVYNQGYPTNRYPTAWVAKLLARFAAGGDQVVSTGSDFSLLAAYAVKRTNGSLSLLVLNKSSASSLNAAIALSGFIPLSNATVYSYGIPQDETARTNGPVQNLDVATNSISSAGTSFSYTFPPYSATVLSLPFNATNMILASSANPSIYGSPVTFTATITTNGVAAADATGTVTFQDAGNNIGTGSVSGGQATLAVSTLSAGTHSITAAYGGDAHFPAITSSALSQLVNPLPVVLSGSRVYDGTSNISAANLTIANLVGTDNVTLSGAGMLASKDVGSQAITASTNLYLAPALVQSSWAGWNSWGLYPWLGTAPNFGNAILCVIATRNTASNGFVNSVSFPDVNNFTRIAQAVNAGGVTCEIWYCPTVRSTNNLLTVSFSNPNTNAVCLVAEYTNLVAAGALDQIAGAANTGTAAVTGATPTTTLANELWVGGIGYANTNALTGILNGFTDVASQSSTYPATNGVNQVTLHLLARAVTATGTASSGGTIGASQRWAGAIATFKAVSVPSGLMLAGPAAANYTLTGATGTATVTPAPSSLLLSSSANPSLQGSSVTFTATVSSGIDTPSGTVVFLANGVAFSTNTLVSGVASAADSLLPAGTNTVAAQFAAQGNYQASGASLQQVVRSASFVLSSTWNGSQLALSWPAGGLLLEAPTPNGPWTTNTAGASSCTITPTNGMQFFRALVP